MDLRDTKRQYLTVFKLRFCRIALPALQGGEPVDFAWQDPPDGELPLAGEIHLWLLDLDCSGVSAENSWEILSSDEKGRAERFHFEADRQRFVSRRAVLRQLLGRYLVCPSSGVRFVYNSFGKPGLAGASEPGSVQFNLSATAELAVYSFSGHHCLGIDLEKLQPGFQWGEIVDSFFHPAEAGYIRQLPDSEQLKAFFLHWTMREAVAKAQGVGLREDLAQVDFTPCVRDGRRLLTDAAGSRWSCISFEPNENCVAALAVEG